MAVLVLRQILSRAHDAGVSFKVAEDAAVPYATTTARIAPVFSPYARFQKTAPRRVGPVPVVALCGPIRITARSANHRWSSTPSTRRLLDGVAMPVPRRSTEPGRPRHRRAPDTLVDFHTGGGS